MAAERTVTEAAPAKVNLFLHVTGRRDDGYHFLDSLVVFAGVGDSIAANAADTLSLRIGGKFGPALAADDDNLVLRAARALRDEYAPGMGADILLEKNLPVASGIGGGSADAAATLRALCTLWGVTPDAPGMAKLALSLGADVPVCLAGRTQRMQGIGETLADVQALPPLSIVLVNPGVAVPTPAVFKARTGGFSARAFWPDRPLGMDGLFRALNATHNDLEAAAVRVQPVIGDVLAALRKVPDARLVRMSGSGATCFALFERTEDAGRVAQTLRAGHPDWWVAAAVIL